MGQDCAQTLPLMMYKTRVGIAMRIDYSEVRTKSAWVGGGVLAGGIGLSR